jgi:VanZ family protein
VDLVNGDRAHTENGLARSPTVDKRQPMRAGLVMTSLRVLTWCCVILLAVLSLLPGQVLAALSLLPPMKMVRTVCPAPLEHFVAYAGVAAIATAGYGPTRGSVRIIGTLCVYAGLLEYIRHFSPSRHPSLGKFTGSALGALCGGLVIVLLWRRRSDQPR